MIRFGEPAGEDVLAAWASRVQAPARPSGRTLGLRFAFYGRVSTADFQERESSRRWQRDVAEDLIARKRDEGRFLGGRPLYGYRLVDAGPHPNPMHAKWGRRLQRYDPDPSTAPIVRWIFAERLGGRSVAGIAAVLNERSVPCPSQAGRTWNRHRAGLGWAATTVRAILGNAKYTGRQVWNRQPAQYTPPHLPGPFRTQGR